MEKHDPAFTKHLNGEPPSDGGPRGRAPSAAAVGLPQVAPRRRARGSARRRRLRCAQHHRLHAAPRSAGARDPLLVPARRRQGDRRERLQDRDDEPLQLVLPRDPVGRSSHQPVGARRLRLPRLPGRPDAVARPARPRARRRCCSPRPCCRCSRRSSTALSRSTSWTPSARSASASMPRARSASWARSLAHRARVLVRRGAVRAGALRRESASSLR